MNPKDIDENKIIINNMHKNMPLHTDNNFKIKHSFDQNFPKNLMDYSEKINKEYLDENLAIIEELNYKDKNNKLVFWFKNYQNKIYGKRNISIHDNFLKIKNFVKNYDKTSVLSCGFLINPYSFGVGVAPQSEILGESQGSTNLGGGYNTDILGTKSQTLATVGNYVSQIAIKVLVSGGASIRGGIYDNLSTAPNNLITYSNSGSATVDYNYRDLVNTSATITTTTTWAYAQTNSNSLNFGGDLSGMSGKYAINSWLYNNPSATWGATGNINYLASVKWRGV